MNSESASIFPIPATTKVLPASLFSSLGPVDWSSQLPTPPPQAGSRPGRSPSSLTPQGPAASPASATLGPGHCRRLCGRAAIRPGGHRTLAEHLLPGAGTASCVREKLSLFPSRVSTLASGREILGVTRRMLDSSPLWGVPDTARIAPGERGGQIHDPGVKLGRSGNSSVDYAFARLHLFVERLRRGKEILYTYTCPPQQEVSSTSVFQTLGKFANLECHHMCQTSVRKPRTQAPRAGMRSASRYL